MIIKGDDSESIPNDLIMEILSRLPVKSILRFRCMSKLWGSMLLRSYFTDLFVTISSSRPPRLLFLVDSCFFSCPQPQTQKSIVVAADFQMKFPREAWPEFCDFVSGLIYFSPMWISKNDMLPVICNPTTRQYASLPLPKGTRSEKRSIFLGFDPIDKQFKVFYISLPNHHGGKEEHDQRLTLGSTGNDLWRKIHCPLNHYPYPERICINGVLYYLARQTDELHSSMIVCFDVRSETFKFIYKDFVSGWHETKLINYKGKLGVITLKMDYGHNHYGGRLISLELWVIKDVEKPESSEWSKYFSYSLEADEFVHYKKISIVGVTATGEIVLSTYDTCKPFYVFFLNPERKSHQRVEILGFENPSRVKVFIDHVEDLKFITMKTTTSAANRPQQKTT